MESDDRIRRRRPVRAIVAVSLLVAVLATVCSLYRVSLAPLGLQPRAIEMATASTKVVVDTPRSALLDLDETLSSLASLHNRAVLLGNLVATRPVREATARSAGIPIDVLQVSAPRTLDEPRAVVGVGAERRTTDLLRSPDQHRLSVLVNPATPVLEINTQAPTAGAAAALANGAVTALRAMVQRDARAAQTPDRHRVRLVQLGPARGKVINESVRIQAGMLVFGFAFALCALAVALLRRVIEGWRLAGRPRPAASH